MLALALPSFVSKRKEGPMRHPLKRIVIVTLVLAGLSVGAIELAHSDVVLNSKTYELLFYRETGREAQGDRVLVDKEKRFRFLPGSPVVTYVQDSTGKTLDRKPGCSSSCDRVDALEPEILPVQNRDAVTETF